MPREQPPNQCLQCMLHVSTVCDCSQLSQVLSLFQAWCLREDQACRSAKSECEDELFLSSVSVAVAVAWASKVCIPVSVCLAPLGGGSCMCSLH